LLVACEFLALFEKTRISFTKWGEYAISQTTNIFSEIRDTDVNIRVCEPL